VRSLLLVKKKLKEVIENSFSSCLRKIAFFPESQVNRSGAGKLSDSKWKFDSYFLPFLAVMKFNGARILKQ
jgi:hypothetical protein